VVGESVIWVLFPLMASNYRAAYTSNWVVILISEWLTDFLEAKAIREHLMDFIVLEEVDPSSGKPLEL
jgi:hypothetical protein